MPVAASVATVEPASPCIGHPTGSPIQLIELADEYYRAAELLQGLSRAGAPSSRAPFRLAAIHAVELYLSAFLLHAGQPPPVVRSYGHDLAARCKQATPLGLVLRQRTLAHLAQLTDTREYLMSRYAAEGGRSLSPPTRLDATMREVRRKVLLATGLGLAYSHSIVPGGLLVTS